MTEDQSVSVSRPILVGIDFSPFSEAALLWATEAARRLGAPVEVLHVVHDPGSAPGYYSHIKKHRKHLTCQEEAAEDMMQDFLAVQVEDGAIVDHKLDRQAGRRSTGRELVTEVVGVPISVAWIPQRIRIRGR